jgi:hypothetical protein
MGSCWGNIHALNWVRLRLRQLLGVHELIVPVEIAWTKMAVRWEEAEMMSGAVTAAIRARNRNNTFTSQDFARSLGDVQCGRRSRMLELPTSSMFSMLGSIVGDYRRSQIDRDEQNDSEVAGSQLNLFGGFA